MQSVPAGPSLGERDWTRGMAPGSRAPSPCPPRADRQRSAWRGGCAGSCPRRPYCGVTILPVRLRLLLLAPAAELHVSPNHYLQRGVDDVVWRTLDEGGVLLDSDRDRFLQLVFALHHLRWFVNYGHSVLLFFLFLIGVTGHGENTWELSLPSSLGWSDRHGFRGNESGVAPAQPGV